MVSRHRPQCNYRSKGALPLKSNHVLKPTRSSRLHLQQLPSPANQNNKFGKNKTHSSIRQSRQLLTSTQQKKECEGYKHSRHTWTPAINERAASATALSWAAPSVRSPSNSSSCSCTALRRMPKRSTAMKQDIVTGHLGFQSLVELADHG